MSFNVRYDTPDDKYRWTDRRNVIAEIVNTRYFLIAQRLFFRSPDLLGLQEPLHHQLEDLKQLLPVTSILLIVTNVGL